MITKKLLDKIDVIFKNLDSKFKHLDLSKKEKILSKTAKLNEEVWELNSDILNNFYKKDKFSRQNLKWEFADVVICTLLLAKSMKIDINKALDYKLQLIKKRWGI